MIDFVFGALRRRRRPPRRWCPICRRHTAITVVLATTSEFRDHPRSGDIGRLRVDGRDRYIFVSGHVPSCAACQFPHAYEETQ